MIFSFLTSMSSHVYILSWSLYCVCPALRNIWNLRSSLFTPKPQIFVCWLFVLMEHCWHIYCLQICHTEWNMHHKCETNGTMPCSFWPAHRGVSLKEHCHTVTTNPSFEFWVLDWMFQMYNLVSEELESITKCSRHVIMFWSIAYSWISSKMLSWMKLSKQ